MAFLETVLSIMNKKNISKNKILTDLKLSKSSFIDWQNRGTIPGGETLVKIADYLNCSVDYLLGRTDNPIKTVSSNDFSNSTITNSTVGTNSAKITVQNNQKNELSEQSAELLKIFENLNIREQTKLLSFAFELESQNKNS